MLLLDLRHSEEKTSSKRGQKFIPIHLVDSQQEARETDPWVREQSTRICCFSRSWWLPMGAVSPQTPQIPTPAGTDWVPCFTSHYRGTTSPLPSSPLHLSGSLRGSNGKVINTFPFSVLLPPVQISITHSDKEKMKLQSVRLQVFTLTIGAVFKTL